VTCQFISVVMPVYNTLPYLDKSIASILNQTFQNFELIIRNDGSTDGSQDLLADWARRDYRIKLFDSGQNLGPVGSSNWVVSKASFPLVARMDADDEAHPDRLLRQFEVFQERPEVGLVGTLFDSIDTKGNTILPSDRSLIVRKSFFAPFAHGSIMLRREMFDRVGGYRDPCIYWEDLDLYLRCARAGRVMILADTLYRFRYAPTSTRVTANQDDLERAVDLMLRCVAEATAGRNYDALLSADKTDRMAKKLNPVTFVFVGYQRLWLGQSTKIFKSICRRATLGLDVATAKALLWAVWADFSPGTLRACIKALKRLRDCLVRDKIIKGKLYDWPAGGLSER
jgi:glycosyltransferase involved in cell wall biosynthesis